MRIKTETNKMVQDFVSKEWPDKIVHYNYKDDSSRIREINRWIQVSTPINDPYIHYEIINDKIELHFEYSKSKNEGITAHADLIDYLEKNTEADYLYEWIDEQNSFVACIYKKKFNDCEDMLNKLKILVTFFDSKIRDYINKEKPTNNFSVIEVAHNLPLPEHPVDLITLKLEKVFERNLSIPNFQRIYCWDEKNVKYLLNDLSLHTEQGSTSSPPISSRHNHSTPTSWLIRHHRWTTKTSNSILNLIRTWDRDMLDEPRI